MPRRKSSYKNGVRIVRFPGGRVAKFHKPGTVGFAKGAAKKRAAGKRLAKIYGFTKKRRTVKSNPKRSNRKVYDPFTHKMVRVKPIHALMGGTTTRRSKKKSNPYVYEVIAGSPKRPQGWVGRYKTKKEAEKNKPLRYASYIKRILVEKKSNPRRRFKREYMVGLRTGGSGSVFAYNQKEAEIKARRKYHKAYGVETLFYKNKAVKYFDNPRVSKTEVLHIVQGHYPQYGWEDLAASLSWTEARDDLRTYRENQPGVYRLIKRRVKKDTNPKRKVAKRKTAKRRSNPSDAFNVYSGRKLIDTVFAQKGSYTAAEMKKSLIEHDGYDYNITVKKARKTRK